MATERLIKRSGNGEWIRGKRKKRNRRIKLALESKKYTDYDRRRISQIPMREAKSPYAGQFTGLDCPYFYA